MGDVLIHLTQDQIKLRSRLLEDFFKYDSSGDNIEPFETICRFVSADGSQDYYIYRLTLEQVRYLVTTLGQAFKIIHAPMKCIVMWHEEDPGFIEVLSGSTFTVYSLQKFINDVLSDYKQTLFKLGEEM